MKRWLYVVQQRLAITNREATALLTIAFLLLLGLVVGEVRSRMPRFGDETYAADDALFRQGMAISLDGMSVNIADSSGAVQDSVDFPSGSSAMPGSRPRAGPQIVDLNTATASDLETLPRIGPKIAQRIIEFRNMNGPFETLVELKEVRGIGDATFDRLRSLIRIAPTGESSVTDTMLGTMTNTVADTAAGVSPPEGVSP